GDVWLGDIWPSNAEVEALLGEALNPEVFRSNYAEIKTNAGKLWNKISGVTGDVYNWPSSTYIAEPPFFADFDMTPAPMPPVRNARALAIFGDSVATGHISRRGSIKEGWAAGQYLPANGVSKEDLNIPGSRRGNHQVMVRGTFANVRIKNLMIPPAA